MFSKASRISAIAVTEPAAGSPSFNPGWNFQSRFTARTAAASRSS